MFVRTARGTTPDDLLSGLVRIASLSPTIMPPAVNAIPSDDLDDLEGEFDSLIGDPDHDLV